MTQFSKIDLFAGCGGLSLGLEYAGFHPVFVNEINNDALNSYLINSDYFGTDLHEPDFHCHDIKDLVSDRGSLRRLKKRIKEEFSVDVANGDLDLITGGPPCQGFSGIGHRRSYSVDKKQLPSNYLYQDMAWVIHQLKPKIFLFENVRGLISARWTKTGEKGEIWRDVLDTFQSLRDYEVNCSVLSSKHYGVPQNRPRVLLVGIRKDIHPNIDKNRIDRTIAGGFLPPPTFQAPDLVDLLGDLVDPKFIGGGKTLLYPHDATNELQIAFRQCRASRTVAKKGDEITEHSYSKHSRDISQKFEHMLKTGGLIPAHLKTNKFSQRLLPPRWDSRGPTITATSLPDDYVHFSQPRTLTVREWARLQGFPDWYQFAGNRTSGGIRRAGNPKEGNHQRDLPKYTQIGNAVPVWLAYALGEHFKKILE